MGKKSSVSSICVTVKVLAYPLNRSQREPGAVTSSQPQSSGQEHRGTRHVRSSRRSPNGRVTLQNGARLNYESSSKGLRASYLSCTLTQSPQRPFPRNQSLPIEKVTGCKTVGFRISILAPGFWGVGNSRSWAPQ